MIHCTSCGAPSPERYQRCGQCGAPLRSDSAASEVRRFATVVNSDLKGSTALGEKLDPESLREVLSRYFDEMRLVFESHGGTIEKIIGDAVVAVFGLPVRRDDDAIRAVRAAGESMRVLAALNDQLEATWGVRLVTRTGVSSGDVVVGEAAAGQHVLTGDTMRISSAMEQNSPPLEVLIAQPTIDLVRDLVEVEALGPITPKGMDISVESYRLVGLTEQGEAAAAAALARPDQGAATDGEGMACPTCGFENDQGTSLCGMCGSAVQVRGKARESRKTVTLVFADPKPTTLTGEPPSPEALRDVMTRYFEAMRAALSRHGGTVEKFIGDAVMAVYGLPVRHEDDAIRAIRAAAEMQAALPALNAAFREEWGLELRNHIGVNTGEVIAGDAATGQRLVTGDAVNTAARLEQAAGAMEIILGDLTWRLAKDQVEVEPIPPLSLKGKAEPVPAYRLVRVLDRPAETAADSSPFVGREAEMGRLSEALALAAQSRSPRILTILGDAGVGKSRLIREFISAVGGSATILSGRCLTYGDGITFWPLSEMVHAAADIAADDQPDVAIARILDMLVMAGMELEEAGEVANRIAVTMGLADAQYPVAELFWGARKLLEALARNRPLVAFIDDIHSAEPTFLDLLDHVVDASEDAPVFILTAARHALRDRHPGWTEAHVDRLIVLEPLSDSDTDRMIGELLGGTGLDRGVVARIVQSAEGNPLFVEQMVSLLVDSGALRREGDRWVATGSAAEIRIPPSIHALLAARLDDLSDDEKAVVEPASIVGLVFAHAAVDYLVDHFVAGARKPTIDDELVTLARKQFVKPDRLDNEPAYRFGHQMIRDTAYGSLLKRERVVLHERFVEWADALNRQRGRETEFEEILGYHLEQAYRYRRELGPLDATGVDTGIRASARLASAGRRALAHGDYPAASGLLGRAAHLLDPANPDRSWLLAAAGEAAVETGEFNKARELLASAATEAEANGQGSVKVLAELVRLQLDLRAEASTDVEAVMAKTQAAVDQLGPDGDPVALGRAWRLLTLVHGVSGRYRLAGEANARAIDYARRAGDKVLEMRQQATTAMVAFYGPTPADEGIAQCEQVLQIAQDDRRAQAVTLAALSALRAMRGDFETAREDYRHGRAILEELGLRFEAALGSINSGPVELLAGEPTAAEAELRRDYEALDAIGERNYISTIAGLLAEALYRQARYDEADRYASFCQDVAAPSDVYSQYLWRGIRGKLLARQGQAAEGIALAESGVAETRVSDDIGGQANALIFLAEAHAEAAAVAAAAGDAAAIATHRRGLILAAEEACRLFEAKGNTVAAGRASTLARTA